MPARKRIKLVSGWRQSPRWWSARISLVNAAALQAWAQLPTELKAAVPPTLMAWIASGLAVLAIVASLVQQDLPAASASSEEASHS